MIEQIVCWALTALSIIGVVLNAQRKIEGFYFWLFANAGWVVIDFQNGIYAQAGLFLFYFGTCWYGIITWRRLDNAL